MYSLEYPDVMRAITDEMFSPEFGKNDVERLFLRHCDDIGCDECEPGECLSILSYIADNAPKWKPTGRMLRKILESKDVEVALWFLKKIRPFIRKHGIRVNPKTVFRAAYPNMLLYNEIISSLDYTSHDIRAAVPVILRVNYRNPRSKHLVHWMLREAGMSPQQLLSWDVPETEYSVLRDYLLSMST